MELSRRDFMRSTAAFTAVASVLGTSGIAFAQDADQNCLVKVDSPDRNALAKRFKAGSATHKVTSAQFHGLFSFS